MRHVCPCTHCPTSCWSAAIGLRRLCIAAQVQKVSCCKITHPLESSGEKKLRWELVDPYGEIWSKCNCSPASVFVSIIHHGLVLFLETIKSVTVYLHGHSLSVRFRYLSKMEKGGFSMKIDFYLIRNDHEYFRCMIGPANAALHDEPRPTLTRSHSKSLSCPSSSSSSSCMQANQRH